MPGLFYFFIKKYRDRFIYMRLTYHTEHYYEISASNKIYIEVLPIQSLDGWLFKDLFKPDYTEEEKTEAVNRLLRIMENRIRGLDKSLFLATLDTLRIGDDYDELINKYILYERLKTGRKRRSIFGATITDQELEYLEKHQKELKIERERLKKAEKQKKLNREWFEHWERPKKLLKQQRLQKEINDNLDEELKAEVENNKAEDIKDRKETQRRASALLKSPKLFERFCAYIDEPSIHEIDYCPYGIVEIIEVDVGLSQLVPDERVLPLVNSFMERITERVLQSTLKIYKRSRKHVTEDDFRIESVVLNKKTKALHYLIERNTNIVFK